MYVADVNFRGFLSYHQSVGFHDLSPNVNTLVGHNGAGKSNLLAAIRYVIGGLPEKSLNDLTFNGRGRPASQCWVNVVLRDIGNRFPQYENEISLTRKLEHGREKFQVNKKYVTKREFHLLLDSAGLSTEGNSFFMVPQGRVTELATLTDEQRLDALLEICGSKSFERRKQDSEKAFEKKDNAVNHMREVLDSLNERLEQVSQEAEDLRKHLDLRRESRGIQHVQLTIEQKRTQTYLDAEDEKLLHQQRELEAVYEKLSDCERSLINHRELVTDADGKLQEYRAEYQIADKQVNSARAQLRRVNNKEVTAQDESLAMTLQAPTQRISEDENAMAVDTINSDSEDDENEYSFRVVDEEEVKNVEQKLSEVRETLQQRSDRASEVSSMTRKLMLKRGRARQMTSEEIAKNREQALATCDAAISEIKLALESDESKLTEIRQKIADAESSYNEAREASDSAVQKEAQAVRDERSARSELNAAESSRNEAILSLRRAEIKVDKLEKKAEQLNKRIMAFAQASVVTGVRQIRDFVAKMKLDPSQYFGTVADLISVQPAFSYALDRYAGPQLFYHVVDNSETVQKIVEALKSSDLGLLYGSAVFIPLADIIVPAAPIVSESEADSETMTPLKDVVTVRDARFKEVVDLLFNKCYVCRQIEVGAFKIARKYGITMVSIEGDMCDPRGAISGGSNTDFIASQAGVTSRIDLIRELGNLYDEISLQRENAAVQRTNSEQAAQKVTHCGDLSNQARANAEHCALMARERETAFSSIDASFSSLKSKENTLVHSIESNNAKLKNMEDERLSVATDTSFASELTADEETQLEELLVEEQKLKQDCLALEKDEFTWAKKSHQIQKAFHQQQAAADRISEVEKSSHESEENQQAYKIAQEAYVSAQREVQRLRQEIMNAERDVTKYQEQLDTIEEQKAAIDTELNTLNKRLELQSRKVDSLKKLLADFEAKLSSLGIVPEAALVESRQISESSNDLTGQELADKVESLTTKRAAIEREIKDLGSVNMQAINDYERYTNMLKKHQTEYEDLVRERAAIKDSFNHLDSEKSEQIEEMIKRVSTKFQEMFTALTGHANGKLLVTKDSTSQEVVSIGFDVPYGSLASLFSSGQKTVCALAFIFAAQACQPAPFYVFDEIDANLDEATRTRLANIIKEISHNYDIQFICTTFNEELASVGDKHYRVRAGFNSTYVKETTKEEVFAILNGAIPLENGVRYPGEQQIIHGES